MIDLHVHSSVSDGSLPPEDVVRLAADAGLTAIALTDHDSAAGTPRAAAAGQSLGIEVIPGIEMTCIWHTREIHILGYFVDTENPAYRSALSYFASKRKERNETILDNLAEDGILLTEEDFSPNTSGKMLPAPGKQILTLGQIAEALTARGFARDKENAMQQYLTYGGRYVPASDGAAPAEVLDFFRAGGIWPSLAHPVQYHLKEEELGELLQELVSEGLRGIEVWHPTQSSYESARLLTICRMLHLLPTGGSDFHGDAKPDIRIGRGFGNLNVADSVLEDIRQDHAESAQADP